ncbi:MAG: NADH:flavin oxidoreductase, partial [Lentisphaeria bacterium]
TRFFTEIAAGIRSTCPGFPISARLSIFDILPFVKGADGVGQAMPWDGSPYPFAFGADASGMDMDENLRDTVEFVDLLMENGVQFIAATVGSPYYNVHLQRPAYFPVCDGYAIPENPLYNVARHLKAVRRLKQLRPGLRIVGSGYSCLQEFLPNVAEYTVANQWTDWVGIGRMVLSYPDIYCDFSTGKALDRKRICRTFGDCTNAPRCGFVSGCYPLDQYYKLRPEAQQLKALLQKNR